MLTLIAVSLGFFAGLYFGYLRDRQREARFDREVARLYLESLSPSARRPPSFPATESRIFVSVFEDRTAAPWNVAGAEGINLGIADELDRVDERFDRGGGGR